MKKWSYCLCPKPSISISQPAFSPPASGRIDGTCLSLSTTVPSTVKMTVSTTTAGTSSATTAIPTTASAVSPSTTSGAAVSTFTISTLPSIKTSLPTSHLPSAPSETSSLISNPPTYQTASEGPSSATPSYLQSTGSIPTSAENSQPPHQIVTTAGTPTSASAKESGGSSPTYIGIGVGMGLLFIAIVVVVAVFARRRGRRQSTDAYDLKEQAMEMDLRSSRIHSPSYAVVSLFENEDYEYRDSSVFQRSSGLPAEYCQPALTETTSTAAQIFQNPLFEDDGNYEVPVNLAQSQAVSGKTAINELKDDIYWEPAKTEERLYDQLSTGKFRVLERSSVQLEEILGTGQFGTVERGIWTDKDSKSPIVVAVKTLKSESEENKVKFLQEAAIMGQFNHRNVVVMHGVVLTGRPLMVVLEILPKGDLKQFLQSIANEDTLPSDLPARLLQMSRDIAAGMEYLAKRCFVHRDLAARNVLLGEKLVCKIADFGLSRDLADDNYYVTKGGQIPFRWTAPEAINFRKYSTSSDVWSYGIVLYEIWTVGKRPYGNTKNRAVLDLLETGYRLPPPPGCSYAVYKLMIECWNPDHHKRPTFNAISTRLSQPDEMLLVNDANTESIQGSAGDDLEASESAYRFLQEGYKVSCAYN
ncbi:uncharacterized protein [Oscarella lobularis]|uniref:uncharacterized protein n=1 Tax=Oscarella lobularis TaxID=121494 RepID=UPI00331414A7